MWINRLERKFGKYAIKDLPIIMAFTYAIGYLLLRFNGVYSFFVLDPYKVIHEFQVWRLFTWIFCTGEMSSNLLFLAITVFFYYSIARVLTEAWGAFRFNLFIFSGLMITLIGTFLLYGGIVIYYNVTGLSSIFGFFDIVFPNGVYYKDYYSDAEIYSIIGSGISFYVSTYYVFMSTLLAFATTFPDMQILLYFIIPVKMKWLGIVYAAMLIYSVIFCSWVERIIIVFSLLNFIIFFISTRKNKQRYSPAEMKRRADYRKKVKKAKAENENRYENGVRHKCCICGRTDVDSPELTFRYCSKCTGGKEYCSEHLFTHVHK